jgi:hypothetical protein
LLEKICCAYSKYERSLKHYFVVPIGGQDFVRFNAAPPDKDGDGFNVMATYVPGCYQEFVDFVVPELQRRGRYRQDYSGSTLRHHLSEY